MCRAKKSGKIDKTLRKSEDSDDVSGNDHSLVDKLITEIYTF